MKLLARQSGTMRNTRRLLAMLACGFGAAACSGDDRPAYLAEGEPMPAPSPGQEQELPPDEAGRLRGTDCPITVPDGQTVSCGKLTVPLDYEQPDGLEIELSVLVFEGQGDQEPAIYLEGGPGGAASLSLESLFDYFEPLLSERDLVVLDQRGTGFSSPVLHCPDLDQQVVGELTSQEEEQALVDVLRTCAEGFRDDGVEPGLFSTRANAADVDLLRQALGYDQWHLLGVSYGTRLALDVMRYHPDGVKSAVLDSVLPPDVTFLADSVSNQEATLLRIFEHCEQQAACAASYPNLQQSFYDVVLALNEQPTDISLRDGSTHVFDGTDAMELFALLEYSSESIPLIPQLVTELSERRFGNLTTIVRSLEGGGEGVPALAIGMYLSVVCSEYVAYSTPEEVQADIDSVNPVYATGRRASQIFDVCDAWNVAAAPIAERQPVASDIPTLVLSGRYDPVTPTIWGEHAAETLSDSYFAALEGAAHAVFATPCGPTLIRGFWDDPAQDPTDLCPTADDDLVFQVPPPSTTASTNFTALAGTPQTRSWPRRLRHIIH